MGKITVFLTSLLLLLLGSISFAESQKKELKPLKSISVPETNEKKKEEIPIKINVGFGLSQYKWFDVYEAPSSDKELANTTVFGTELNISGVVDKKTIQKYKNKVPEKYRNAVGKLEEVSVSHILIPKTLYIQPENNHRKAYGATWGLVPALSTGIGPLRFGLLGGIILTYMYFNDDRFNESVNFIRPGLRGGLMFQLSLFDRYFVLEGGVKGDIYWSQKFYGSESVWNSQAVYLLLNFRFPTTLEAKI